MQLAQKTWDQMMPGVDLSVGLFYLGLFVGQIHCCLHVGTHPDPWRDIERSPERDMILTIVIVFVFFSITGMPIAFALGLAGLAGILVERLPDDPARREGRAFGRQSSR